MEPITLNNPVFNDQFAGQLASSGSAAVAVGLVILQILIIPLGFHLFKAWNAKQKQIIDLETENRKMARDEQISNLDHRLSHLEKDNNYKIEEMARTMERMNTTMTRLFEKFDKLTEKMEDFVIRVVKLEK